MKPARLFSSVAFPRPRTSGRVLLHTPVPSCHHRAPKPFYYYYVVRQLQSTMADTTTPTNPVMKDGQSPLSASHSSPPISVKWTNVNTAPGVELSPDQKLLVGSVLEVSCC